jgi:hypothetical protein
MATLKELVYDLWEAVEPVITKDTPLDERKLEFFIHNQRALWIKNFLSKNRTLDESVKQIHVVGSLGAGEYEGLNAKIANNIPTLIERNSGNLITKVYTNINLNIGLNLSNSANTPYLGNGRFNSKQIFAIHRLNSIYILSNEDLSAVSTVFIEGVFENPTKVGNFTSESSEYPLQMWMWNYIKGEILRNDLFNSSLKSQPNAEEESSS